MLVRLLLRRKMDEDVRERLWPKPMPADRLGAVKRDSKKATGRIVTNTTTTTTRLRKVSNPSPKPHPPRDLGRTKMGKF